jgi:hypothetical protein
MIGATARFMGAIWARLGYDYGPVPPGGASLSKSSSSTAFSGYDTLGYDTDVNAAGITDEMNIFRRTLSDLTNIAHLVYSLPLPHLWGMEKHFTWSGGHLRWSLGRAHRHSG